MTFQITRISKGCNTPLETSGFVNLMCEYLQQKYSETAIKNGLLYDLMGQISAMEKHAILAYNAQRDKRGEIVRHTFHPKGIAYFRLRENEGKKTIDCGIEHIFTKEGSIGTEVMLINNVVGEIKDFCRGLKIASPTHIKIDFPRYANKDLERYFDLGFELFKETEDKIILKSRISSLKH